MESDPPASEGSQRFPWAVRLVTEQNKETKGGHSERERLRQRKWKSEKLDSSEEWKKACVGAGENEGVMLRSQIVQNPWKPD